MQHIVERVLREQDDTTLDEQREIATEDILLDIVEMLQRRGVVKAARVTPRAISTLGYWEARLVADAYRKRRAVIGDIRVFVSIPSISKNPAEPARVRMDWALKIGGVWYSDTVRVKDPLGARAYHDVIRVVGLAQRTLDGVIPVRRANTFFRNRKRQKGPDTTVLQGLRLIW